VSLLLRGEGRQVSLLWRGQAGESIVRGTTVESIVRGQAGEYFPGVGG